MTLDSSEAVTPPVAPPRPPKPAHISTPSYFGRGKENIDKNATGEKVSLHKLQELFVKFNSFKQIRDFEDYSCDSKCIIIFLATYI